MERTELVGLARDVMTRADMLVLATVGEDPFPRLRALFNLRNAERFPGLAAYQADKGLSVFLGTNTSSDKLRDIEAEAWVSVYFMLPDEFKGLCLSGRAVADPLARAALWVEGWEMYYPAGPDDPDYTVLRIDPDRARGWSSSRSFDFDLESKTFA